MCTLLNPVTILLPDKKFLVVVFERYRCQDSIPTRKFEGKISPQASIFPLVEGKKHSLHTANKCYIQATEHRWTTNDELQMTLFHFEHSSESLTCMCVNTYMFTYTHNIFVLRQQAVPQLFVLLLNTTQQIPFQSGVWTLFVPEWLGT